MGSAAALHLLYEAKDCKPLRAGSTNNLLQETYQNDTAKARRLHHRF